MDFEECLALLLPADSVQSVRCIELVLTECTTDTDLQEVIEVLAEQEHLQEVSIREIQPVHMAAM
eukprot:gene13250-13380_t